MNCLKIINSFLLSVGINLRNFKNIFLIFKFFFDFIKFKKAGGKVNFFAPILGDHLLPSGNFDSHYFKQDIYVANKIYKNKPLKHLDIGSRFDGFVSHVASFRNIEVIDLRENRNDLMNIDFKRIDITEKIDDHLYQKYDSVSCLHALEHFGLGRYGDKIAPDAHIQALDNIEKLIKPQGVFYLSVPVSNQNKTYYNSHKVFDPAYIPSLTSNLTLEEFTYIDNKSNIFINSKISELKKQEFNYFCGIFVFKKN